jgi:hypothetical protein
MILTDWKRGCRRRVQRSVLAGGGLAFWLFTAVFCLPAQAAPTTADQALAVVSGWLSLDAAPLGARLGGQTAAVTAYGDISGLPAYYVVTLDGQGLVIVPADDEVEPIVAFSPSGQFDPSETNPFGALVSNDIPGRVMAVRQPADKRAAQAQAASEAQAKWSRFLGVADKTAQTEQGIPSVSDVRVSPLIATTWSQDTAGGVNTYNIYTPDNRVCGCVATAMAQLMRFHQFPTAGVGTASFNIFVCGVPMPRTLRGGNGSGGAYDWANMVLSPNASTSETQRNAIGALTADAGVSVNMNYCDSSGTDTLKAAAAFKSTFGYSNAVTAYNSQLNLPATARNTMVNANLDAGYPVLFGITGAGGHAIVGDGYGYDAATLYHHLNMGWSGSGDVWYNLPTISAGGYNFTSVYKVVYNVYVGGSGEIISGRVLDSQGNPVSGATVTATRSGGGVYTATTNAKGIYALAKVPAASTYTVAVAKSGYTFASKQAVTATSTDDTTTTGNVWGLEFAGATVVRTLAPEYLLLQQ